MASTVDKQSIMTAEEMDAYLKTVCEEAPAGSKICVHSEAHTVAASRHLTSLKKYCEVKMTKSDNDNHVPCWRTIK